MNFIASRAAAFMQSQIRNSAAQTNCSARNHTVPPPVWKTKHLILGPQTSHCSDSCAAVIGGRRSNASVWLCANRQYCSKVTLQPTFAGCQLGGCCYVQQIWVNSSRKRNLGNVHDYLKICIHLYIKSCQKTERFQILISD